ncbi:MAG: DUF411 domain-containing protein [Candidatus Kerfeldbacteria bacterium]
MILRNKIIIIVGIIVLAGGVYFVLPSEQKSTNTKINISSDGESDQVTMYKSPTCGCCVKHASYVEDAGYEVDIIKESNMSSIKDKYNIPADMESCHTSIYGDYIVEGHVPMEAINKMLTEKPDIDGIALPDMPAGSPGMPGTKVGKFTIYALKDGVSSVYMKL